MSKSIRYLYSTLIYFFLYLPIVVVVVFSFNDANRSLSWQGFTWKHYLALLGNQPILQAALNSLILAILVAILTTLLGFLVALTTFRYRFYGRKIIHGLTATLVVVPEIVIAVSLLLLYKFFKIPLGFWSLLFGHATLCIPFATIIITEQFSNLDREIFAAAADLGASEGMTIHKVILPLVSPALIAAWLLTFTLSLDNLIISYFVGGPSYTLLPSKIYAMVRSGVQPEINALCTLMIFLTFLVTIIAYRLLFRSQTHD